MKEVTVRPRFLSAFFTLCFSLSEVSIAGDTISASEQIGDGESLISVGAVFELGFFSPGNSTNRYVGIWYKKVPERTYVWVANRENQLTDSSGVLKIDDQGSIVILNGRGRIIWSSEPTNARNPVLRLLDNGNLVLGEEGNKDSQYYLWQSFDNPSDTLLPGMKLGFNWKTGLDRFLTSWRNADDPSVGDYTFMIDHNGSRQSFITDQSSLIYRGGPWNGITFSPEMETNYLFEFQFVSDQDEVYYRYELTDRSITSRLVLNQMGQLQRSTWINRSGGTGYWNLFWQTPNEACDGYNKCGPYGMCKTDLSQVCSCLKGFEPKSPEDWYLRVTSGGCQRKTLLDCQRGDGFIKLERVKLPNASNSSVNMSMSLKECEEECLKNCSCTAYSIADVRGGGSGCIMWVGDLIDLRRFSANGQDLYVRIAGSELGGGKSKKQMIIIVSVSTISAMFLSGWIFYCICWKKKNAEGRGDLEDNQEMPLFSMVPGLSFAKEKSGDNKRQDFELPLFDLATVASATDNLSAANKLGEGGFGPVYKGRLANGQEIAVKRLSVDSEQGTAEFMNEVSLIAKLQHRNLVRLLGCCIQGEEKILIYEYMKNRSLDSILFDEKKRVLLDWRTRLNIIMGIARGLLYLHQDSRFRIIHRDLKASNILLDDKLNAKISDFGTARIFGRDQVEAKTKRVIGTHGYMPPEYAMDGHFSDKTDVFGFGVLVLEIVTGRRNRGFFHADDDHNLLGHTWRFWKEAHSLELLDPSLNASCDMSEVLRCVQLGLLCVQERADDRPTMELVLLMLGSENPIMPQPKLPGFFAAKSLHVTSNSKEDPCTINDVTLTTLEVR